MPDKSQFHFPIDIHLEENSLVEAWLEIRWKSSTSAHNQPPIDLEFPFALGVFRSSIKNKFPVTESKPFPEEIPLDMTLLSPVVRYQFWSKGKTWPVVQMGPGIATLNFTRPYTWGLFREQAVDLREELLNAYSDTPFTATELYLRYRNALKLDFKNSDFLAYLTENLNTQVRFPIHIPGNVAKVNWPTDFSMVTTYDLEQPLGRGVLRIGTGLNPDKQPVVVFELEVGSKNNEENDVWTEPHEFETWLDRAHAVIHEWFFSLIDGQLKNQYEGAERS